MAEKNTMGAVHLTSLSLDLTTFHENIQQIQDATAQVADTAVENLSKIREALNVPVEKLTFNVDTTGVTQNVDRAQQSIEQFGNTMKSVSAEIKGGQLFTADTSSLESLVQQLGITGENATTAQTKLKSLFDEIKSYDKIQISTAGGDLFRAIVTSSDEAGKSISKIIDLTQEVTQETINSAVTVSDNAEKRNSTIEKANQALAQSLEKINTQYKKFADLVKKSTLDDFVKDEFLKEIQDAQNGISGLQKEILGLSQMATKDDYAPKFDKLDTSLKSLKDSFDKAKESQKQMLDDSARADTLVRGYERLQQQLSTLITSMTSPKFDSPEIDALVVKAKALQSEMKSVSEEIWNSDAASKGAETTFRNFENVISSLNTEFSKAKTANNEYKKSLAPIQQQAKQTVDALKVLEKSATFQTSKQNVAALRAEYEQFINRLKTTHVGTDAATAELAKLDAKFKELEGTIKTGHTWLETWVNKISESAKWQIANSALNLIRSSFGNLTDTIITTENAVIELQRVLSNRSLSNAAIADELYQIAYEFGQTFDAVQETAVKFAQTGMTWSEVVDATRATMLGLNTAELEVTTATEGLIAVMAQFNIDAADLEGVIDKINKTADNFPITSEKIVAALQRAGGTASAFGLSLEETIGIITALGKATGRAGEAIGTAMNSLISFSMKGSALDKFSEFLGHDVSDYGVLQLWTELSAAINDSGEELAKMMSQTEGFSDLMDENLANAMGLQEEYNLALKEQNELTAEGKDIISVVGTYRQNYFIALLKNIQTAIDAINGMEDAVGYSMDENKKAMEAFSKQWNQLVISAQQLAIQFGEAGFLDIMKLFVGIGDAVLQVTKNIGGLYTVLAMTTALFVTIKKQQIKSWLLGVANTFMNFTQVLNVYNTAMSLGYTRMESFKLALSGIQFTAAGTVGAIGLVATAIGGLIAMYNKKKEAEAQEREEAIAAGKEAVNSVNSVAQAYKEYQEVLSNTSSTVDEVNDARENMIKLLGMESNDVDVLIKRNKDLVDGYEDVDAVIKTLTEDEYNLAKASAEVALAKEKEKIANANTLPTEGPDSTPYSKQAAYAASEVAKIMKETEEGAKQLQEIMSLLFSNTNADRLSSDIERLGKGLEFILGITKSEERANDLLYDALVEKLGVYKEMQDEYKAVKGDLDSLGESFEDYIAKIEAGADANDELGESFDGVKWEITETSKAIEELNKLVDTFQSSYKTLTDVISEYNETGYMTADMLQSILSLEPEYIQLLDNKNGQLSINEERLQDLISANDQYLNQLVALTTAEAIDQEITVTQAASKAGLTVEEYKLMYATEGLTSQTYTLVKQLFDGKITTDEFTSSIATLAEQAGITGEYLDGLKDSVLGLVGGYGALYTELSNLQGSAVENAINNANTKVKQAVGSVKRYYTPPSTSKSASSSAKETDPFKEEKESLKELLDIYEHQIFLIEKNEKTTENSTKKIVDIYRKMQEEVHAQAERYRAAGVDENDALIRDLQSQWWSYQDKIEEVMEDLYDEVVKSHKNAINLLEHQYESAEQRLDYSYMGENLKKQLDYQIKIQREAERELERLAKLGMDANSDAAQDVIDTWYAAEKAIREISQKIADDILEPFDDFIDLADHFELWDYMDFTKVDYLREKLAALNKLFEEGTISAKQYSKQLRSISYAIYDAQKVLYEQEKQAVSDRLKGTTDAYKAEQDALKKQKDQLNDYYDSVIDGYNKEIDAWQKKKEQVEDYYDTLIDNLRDVQKANERINKQIDYYNERQKIITNLEQAQARSGVEWREKEMEYQQQLIDLDEEWMRTQEEWSIEDQIEALQKLKDMAIADIDLSIQKIRDTIEATEQAKQAAIDSIEAQIEAIGELITAAEEAAEAEIEVINQKIADMSKTIAESIKNGTVDGLVDSREELDKALVDGTNAMLDFIDKNNSNIKASAEQTANSVYGIYYTDLIDPMNDDILTMASTMATSLAEGAEAGAKQALSAFQTSFIQPLKQEMADLMKQAQSAQATISKASTTTASSVGSKLTSGQLAAFNSGAGPVSAAGATTKTTLPSLVNSGFQSNLIKDASSVFGGLKPQNNIYITNNYKTVEEGASGTQRYLSTLGIN